MIIIIMIGFLAIVALFALLINDAATCQPFIEDQCVVILEKIIIINIL
jgi:hypothetical protein